jgi:hypothetical protein
MSDEEFTELVESTNSPAAKRIAELERELEQERQDRKQAELDVCRALGERNDARAMVNSLRSLVTTEHESKESFIYRVAVTLNMPSRAQMDAHLDECVARSERDWKPLPGDPDVFYPRP